MIGAARLFYSISGFNNLVRPEGDGLLVSRIAINLGEYYDFVGFECEGVHFISKWRHIPAPARRGLTCVLAVIVWVYVIATTTSASKPLFRSCIVQTARAGQITDETPPLEIGA